MLSELFEVPLYQDHRAKILSFVSGQTDGTLPLLTKAELVQAFPQGFMTASLRAAIEAGKVEYANTSGSSEMLHIVRHAGWWRTEFARAYQSLPEMAGYEIDKDRKAVLTTAACSTTSCFMDKPSLSERTANGVLNLNVHSDPNLWTQRDIERIDQELHEYAPALLEVDPTYLALFLRKRALYGLPRSLFRPRWITASYELLTHVHRHLIEAAFGVPVLSMFGSTELGVLFLQNEQGSFTHCTADHWIELRPFLAERRVYELIVTSWKNPFMPLLRYSTGDLVQVAKGQDVDGIFGAGRPLAIDRLHGRAKDVIVLPNGGLQTAAELDDQICQQAPWVFQYQYWRNERIKPFLLWVPDPGRPESMQPARTQTPAFIMLGPALSVELRQARNLAAEMSGKFATIR